MKLRDFQYRYLKSNVPTKKSLSKCQIVISSLCDFSTRRLKQCIICFGSVDMCNSFGQNLEILFEASGFDISISEKNSACNLKNFLISTAKYFIVFVCKYRKKCQFGIFFKYI